VGGHGRFSEAEVQGIGVRGGVGDVGHTGAAGIDRAGAERGEDEVRVRDRAAFNYELDLASRGGVEVETGVGRVTGDDLADQNAGGVGVAVEFRLGVGRLDRIVGVRC